MRLRGDGCLQRDFLEFLLNFLVQLSLFLVPRMPGILSLLLLLKRTAVDVRWHETTDVGEVELFAAFLGEVVVSIRG